jgi:hypothetical protein
MTVMEKANINRMVRNVLFTALAALLSFGPVLQAQAQDKGKDNSVVVKYLGSVGNQPVFQIEFDNEGEEEILVNLKDTDGNVLYQERFKEKKFSKKFQLNHSEDNMKVVLSITTRKDRFTQQYQIDRNTRLVEDIIVTKVR